MSNAMQALAYAPFILGASVALWALTRAVRAELRPDSPTAQLRRLSGLRITITGPVDLFGHD